jgi:Zn-dependent protease with chaperone function
METLFIYLLKSSSIIALVFLVYHFLLRKETFFTFHRWYLLIGLAVSIVLPLYSIQKIVYVEPTATNWEPAIEVTKNVITEVQITTESFEIDWFNMGFALYGIVAIILFLKIIYDVFSLFTILRNRKIDHHESFLYVDIEDDITPFSFFKYIVFNSKLYAQNELESIIAHEKIHSSQGHSYDVLIVKLFMVVFWFNPFIYLYKKAILQNLEYIADQNAIKIINDKKSYQMTLLKVVSNQNCLSITNNFNQSLIKKRIVMLNKNQSHRNNVWKFTMVIPALIAFVFLFQVKTVAQEMYSEPLTNEGSSNEKSNSADSTENSSNLEITNHPGYIFDKITSDNELKENVDELKKEFNIDFKFTNVKRNNKGEIIAIKLSFTDNKGKKGTTEQSREIPIRPIFFRTEPSADGKFDIGFYDNHEMVAKANDNENERKIQSIESITDDMLIYVDGEKYTKEDLEYLDPKGLKSITIFKDNKAIEMYGEKGKNGVAVVVTNWNVPPATPATPAQPNLVAPVAPIAPVAPAEPQKPKVIIFSNDNGDDIVITDNYKLFKVPGSPSVQLTSESPVLIIDGKVQSNPKGTIENIDVTKIKSVRIYDENDKESKGTPIKKIVITTK